uniref:Uncharacterized protein n=1 Tax=Anguilla anguilla TaxID=7936 RepID=A0A0E9PIU3_ANGAN
MWKKAETDPESVYGEQNLPIHPVQIPKCFAQPQNKCNSIGQSRGSRGRVKPDVQ